MQLRFLRKGKIQRLSYYSYEDATAIDSKGINNFEVKQGT